MTADLLPDDLLAGRTPAVERAMDPTSAAPRAAAVGNDNVTPAMVDCARASTLYEIRHVRKEGWGSYR